MFKKIRGFTIVELLIVIVVIGILAAISIVAYSGISNQAHDSAVKNDLSNLKKKIDMYIAESGVKPAPTVYALGVATASFSASKGSYAQRPTTDHNLIYCSGEGATSYAVVAYSKSGRKFRVTNNASVEDYENPWSDQVEACQGAVTNYQDNYRGYAGAHSPQWREWTGQ